MSSTNSELEKVSGERLRFPPGLETATATSKSITVERDQLREDAAILKELLRKLELEAEERQDDATENKEVIMAKHEISEPSAEVETLKPMKVVMNKATLDVSAISASGPERMTTESDTLSENRALNLARREIRTARQIFADAEKRARESNEELARARHGITNSATILGEKTEELRLAQENFKKADKRSQDLAGQMNNLVEDNSKLRFRVHCLEMRASRSNGVSHRPQPSVAE